MPPCALPFLLLLAGPDPSPAGTVLEGTVRAPGGAPVEGARVLARPSTRRGRTGEPLSARTDPGGRFRLKENAPGPMDVRVEADGFAAWSRDKVQPDARLDVRLEKGVAIHGIVRDGESGVALDGAHVEARQPTSWVTTWDDRLGVVSTTSDAQGRYRVEGLAPGLYDVTARARDFGQAQAHKVPAGGSANLFLFSGPRLRGDVTDADGSGLPGAVIRLERLPRGGGRRIERSDAQGRFEFVGLDVGTYSLVARAADKAPAWQATVELPADGDYDAPRLILDDPVPLTGRIVDEEDRPAGGTVSIVEVDGRAVPSVLGRLLGARAGPDGRFRIDQAPPGSVVLAAKSPAGRARVEVLVPRKEPTVDTGDIRLEPGLQLRGNVRSTEGLPIEDAAVWAWTAAPPLDHTSTATDAEGRFQLSVGQAGQYAVGVRAEGYAGARRRTRTGAAPLDIVLEAAGRVSGRVVAAPEGGAVQAFDVSVTSVIKGRRRSSERRSFAAADGHFDFESVGPGTYELSAKAPGRMPTTVPDVVVTAGAGTDVGVIKLAAGGTLRGSVVDGDGAPVPGASVTAASVSAQLSNWRLPQAVSGVEGRFEIRGLSPGRVRVSATHPRYAPGEAEPVNIDPEAGPAEVRISLGRGGIIEGRVQQRDGSGVAGAVLALSSRDALGASRTLVADGDGSFRAERIAPGSMLVTLMSSSGQSRQSLEVTVVEGQTTRADLLLREVLLSGRVTRAGEAIGDVHLRLFAADAPRMMMAGFPGGAPKTVQNMAGVTGADGSYQLWVDTPGRFRVLLQSLGTQGWTTSRQIDVPDVAAHAQDFSLGAATVEGTLLDGETQAPVAEAHVILAPVAATPDAERMTVETRDGGFRIDVEPQRYTLRAWAEDYVPAVLPLDVGPTGLSGVVVTLQRGLALPGRVVDPAGRGLDALRVVAYPTKPGQPPGVAHTKADGTFRLSALAEQRYNLVARTADGHFAVLLGAVPGSDDAVLLQALPGGRLLLTVQEVGGAPVQGARARVVRINGQPVNVGARRQSDAEGRVTLDVPAGELGIAISQSGRQAELTVSIASGQEITATAPLEKVADQQPPAPR